MRRVAERILVFSGELSFGTDRQRQKSRYTSRTPPNLSSSSEGPETLDPRTFLVFHGGALGDFVLTWPTLSVLRAAFPSHRLFGITRSGHLALALRLGLFDAGLNMEDPLLLPFFSGEGWPPGLPRPEGGVLWGGEDLLPRLPKSSTLPYLSISPFPEGKGHVGDGYLEQIRKTFGISAGGETPQWPASLPPRAEVLIHPGSGSPTKSYSLPFYRRLAAFLHETTGLAVRFVYGPVEIDRGLPFPDPWPVVFPPDLVALAGLLVACRFFIGNDSGVSHLAAQLGVPTLAFYRMTDPAVWGVRGKAVFHIVSADEKEAFSLFQAMCEEEGLLPRQERGSR